MKLGGFPAAGRGSSTQDRVWAPQGFGSLGAPPPAPTPNTGPAGAARPAPCWGPEVLQAEGAGRFPLFQGLREGAPEPRCWGVLKTWQARTDASGQFLSPPAPRNTCREETTAGFLGLQQPLAAVRVCRSAARPRGNLPPPPPAPVACRRGRDANALRVPGNVLGGPREEPGRGRYRSAAGLRAVWPQQLPHTHQSVGQGEPGAACPRVRSPAWPCGKVDMGQAAQKGSDAKI